MPQSAFSLMPDNRGSKYSKETRARVEAAVAILLLASAAWMAEQSGIDPKAASGNWLLASGAIISTLLHFVIGCTRRDQ